MNLRRSVFGLGVAAMILTAVTASAGKRWVINVYVGSTYAFGSAGTARASSDNYQQIGCYIEQGNNPNMEVIDGLCCAEDSNGKSACCFMPQGAALTAFEKVVASAGPSSYYYFQWNSTGECTSLQVDNSSQYAPVSP